MLPAEATYWYTNYPLHVCATYSLPIRVRGLNIQNVFLFVGAQLGYLRDKLVRQLLHFRFTALAIIFRNQLSLSRNLANRY